MKEPIFTGSGTAIITPFTAEGVNLPVLRELTLRQIDSGTDAIIVCGTTGEASTMTQAERQAAVACCVEAAAGRIPVIAGSGSNDTRTSIELSRCMAAAGANGLLLVTPYYNKASQQGLIRHFTAIADAVDLPVILYNVPSRTGVSCTAETYAALAAHPRIAGVKEASGDLALIQKTRLLCPPDFFIWSGNDDQTVPICALGGVGVISVAANVLPREMHTLVELCRTGHMEDAAALQLRIKDLCDALFCEVNPIPVKTAMNLLGYAAGELRLPLCEPSAEHTALIRQALEDWKLLEPEM